MTEENVDNGGTKRRESIYSLGLRVDLLRGVDSDDDDDDGRRKA